MSKKKRCIFVGMSGGIDSSVSAHLLQKDGYDVTGVFIQVWEPPFLPCTWREERRDAMRAAAHLSIPLITLDLSEIYKKAVVDQCLDVYRRGETPNPDVLCNKEVKFGAFYQFARSEGAEAIATGHYARKGMDKTNAKLMTALDTEKDQTYFLWTISQEILQHTEFPVGKLQKKEVRAIGKKIGLPNAEKKDSQGICFLGDIDMTEFLQEFIPIQKGNVLNLAGEVIGTHHGAEFYTIGKRHGFTIFPEHAQTRARYVVAKDMPSNTITVANALEREAHHAHSVVQALLKDVSIISGLPLNSERTLMARFRYRQELFPVRVFPKGKTLLVTFLSPQEGLSPGQSIVFYDDKECIGGGVISVPMKGLL